MRRLSRHMAYQKGVVAAGHEEVVRAAELILQEGGNAFDAVVAAHLASCVVEPILSSLGGGSFLLVHTGAGRSLVYDFFVQTPQQKRPGDETNFRPISADFGTAQQEFHIGLGAAATPGVVKGLFAVHHDLCSIPMIRLAEPAIALARDGVVMNRFQAYFFSVVHAIYASTAESRRIYGSSREPGELIQHGERLRQPELADFLEALAREGDALFYEGEIAHRMARRCAEQGGHLTAADLAGYCVSKRQPLSVDYRNANLLINPPPSSGGVLIGVALKLLEEFNVCQLGSGTTVYLDLLARVLGMTGQARLDVHLDDTEHVPSARMLDRDFLRLYKEQIKGKPMCRRGTTHISVMDAAGNIASLSTSNGEGCGDFIPGTGIMLNNMLGEEDLNPLGFHRWPVDQRMTSMLSPTILLSGERRIALGSGGSNRLRTAILQVLLNVVDFAMPLDQAVSQPRIHFEAHRLYLEGGFREDQIAPLIAEFPEHQRWQERNVFFGGTHTVAFDGAGFSGAGDPRRGGVSRVIR